jgi:type II secretory pathway pseudopilin PulG
VNALGKDQAARPAPAPHSRAAFSLLEFIGVLAVIAVLAAVLVPRVTRRLDFAAWSSETASVSAMADALKLYVVRSNAIPDQTQWAAAISSQLGLAPASIATNPRNYSRAYLIDAGGWLQTALASSPWTQTPTGMTTNPIGGRLMIVSTVAGPQLPVPSGPLNAASFNTIWNTPQGASPWPASTWAGKGEDLVVQRINLDPIFFRVILNPIDTNSFGSFAIENNGTALATNLVTGGPFTSWFLQGTVLRFYDANTGNYTLETKAILQADCSYVFENKGWRGQLSGLGTNGPAPGSGSYLAWVAANNFSSLANIFRSASVNIHDSPNYNDTPTAILGAFYSFMDHYNSWVQDNYLSGSGTNIYGASIYSATWLSLYSDSNAVQNLTSRLAQ